MDESWFMPDEAERHERTWMAFGASESIWGRRLLPEVRRNLATVAKTIAHLRIAARHPRVILENVRSVA